MIIESMSTSLIIGKIRKGKFRNFESFELKGWYLFIIGFLLEVSANIIRSNDTKFNSFLDKNFIFIHLTSYSLIFIGLYLNRNRKSMYVIFLGTLLNFVCIMLNYGRMPISLEMLQLTGLVEPNAVNVTLDLTHSLVNENTKLLFLCDIIPLAKPYPLPKVISIGDILLAIGAFWLLQEIMLNKTYNND